MKQRKANRLKGYDYSQNNLYFVTSCVKDMVCCFGDIVGTGRDLSDNNDNSKRTGHDLSLQEARMILNEYGTIVEQQWYWLAEQYSYIQLHEFIVMPNHMHGIIEINSNLITGTVYNNLDNRGTFVGTGRDLSGGDNNDVIGAIPDHSENNDNERVGDGSKSADDFIERTDDFIERTGDLIDRTGDLIDRTGRDLSLPKIKSLSEIMGAYKMTVSKDIHLARYPEFTWQRSFYDHIIRDEKSYGNISHYIVNNPNSWDQDKFFRKMDS
jgi:REP element-mobilizing transposase RayT